MVDRIVGPMAELLTADFNTRARGQASRGGPLLKPLRDIDPTLLCTVAARAALNRMSKRTKLTALARTIGEALEDELRWHHWERLNKGQANAVRRRVAQSASPRHRHAALAGFARRWEKRALEVAWTPAQLIGLGRRFYACSDDLSPQGNDLQRGLLEFAHGDPLDTEGVRWLAIHLANTWGFDKASFAEREQWTYEHEVMILKVADDPLGNREWFDADRKTAWQFLAACFAWKAYREGGIGTVCRTPVMLDGSCSGTRLVACPDFKAKARRIDPEGSPVGSRDASCFEPCEVAMRNDVRRSSLPGATFLGLAAIAACIVWAAGSLGREIRCAGYFAGQGGASEVRVVAARRERGDPLSRADEEAALAGARMAGCWFPKGKG